MSYIVGMDVGGTNTVAGLFGPDGALLRSVKRPTEKSQGAEGLLRQLADLARHLIAGQNEPAARLAAVGIGLPGFIDRETGAVDAANLPLKNEPVAARLKELLGVPVTVQNDVKMIVYGESIRGAGRQQPVVLGLTLGTGLAGALVIDGRIHDGAGGLAGEIGHITLDEIPYACGCGLTGCLETAASATGIARQARDGLANGAGGLLAERFPGERRQAITARDVWQAAADGDAWALAVYRRTAVLLAKVLAPAVTLLSPDVVIVGGGVAAAGDILFAPLREEVAAHVHPLYRSRLRIVPGALGDEAGLFGSAEYARSRIQPPPAQTSAR